MRRGKFESNRNDNRRRMDGSGDQQVGEKPNDLLSYLHDLVFLLTGILLVVMLLFRVVVVSGPSMKNTLIHGDYIVLLNNVLYGEPKQGDIVVVSKEAFKNGEPIIKRVIATEGQWVDIKDGKVYVDNKPLDEKYTLSETEKKTAMEFPLQVEKGCVFVMGDNREVSMDSRYPEIGQVDCREILGKAIFLAFPGEDERTETRDLKRIGGIS